MNTSSITASQRGPEELRRILRLDQTQRRLRRVCELIAVFCATALGSVVACLVFPFSLYAPYGMALVALVGMMVLCRWRQRQDRKRLPVLSQSLLLQHFEVAYPHVQQPLWGCLHQEADTAEDDHSRNGASLREWGDILVRERRQWTRVWRRWLYQRLSVLMLLFTLTSALIVNYPHSIYASSLYALSWLPLFSTPSSLVIVQGSADPMQSIKVELDALSPFHLQVVPENLLRLQLENFPQHAELTVGLSKWLPYARDEDVRQGSRVREYIRLQQGLEREIYQSFRTQRQDRISWRSSMPEQKKPEQGRQRQKHKRRVGAHGLEFQVARSVALWIPELSEALPVGFIEVVDRHPPEVGLVLQSEVPPGTIWPSEDPLALQISAVSEYPLRELALIIQSERGEFTEKVTRIVAHNQKSVVYHHYLHLGPYVADSVSHVHILAQAQAQGESFTIAGRSDAVEITVASAYGRYEQSLHVLRQVRQSLQELTARQEGDDWGLYDERMEEHARRLEASATTTPFFDSWDRRMLQQMMRSLHQRAYQQPSSRTALEDKVTDFLQEHEALDDRERDRDFFVAARSLATMIQHPAMHSQLPEAIRGMTEYMTQRTQRWQQRLDKLPSEYAPEQSQQVVKERQFQNTLENMLSGWPAKEDTRSKDLASSSSPSPSVLSRTLDELSNMTQSFRQWIEDLEAAEGRHRQMQSQHAAAEAAALAKRLQTLQGQQDGIAQQLDGFSQQPQQGMSATDGEGFFQQQWLQIAQEQRSTQEGLRQLLQEAGVEESSRTGKGDRHNSRQGRSNSGMRESGDGGGQGAAGRLQRSLEAMGQVLRQGGQKDFALAESYADEASQLLREQMRHQQSQGHNRHETPPRMRHDVMGQGYFGHDIIHLNWDQKYEVGAQYREHILRDMRSSPQSHTPLLRQYLREVLR